MEYYGEIPTASISMHSDPDLRRSLRDTIKKETISYIIETGTYQGLGSTKVVAECFPKEYPPAKFITIEANWNSWRQAKGNLHGFNFILPIWGKSVPTKKALNFIKNDDVLRNHQQIKHIYIDDVDDPVLFYSNEIKGKLGGLPRRPDKVAKFIFDRRFHYQGENLLEHYLLKYKDKKPLVILDSAGGIGFYEFSILMKALSEKSFIVLLDDIHHIKHFRSADRIRSDKNFSIIEQNQENGWMLAKHSFRRS